MQEYSGKITKELCKTKKFLFLPKTESEAADILLKLFKFCNQEHLVVEKLPECVAGGILMDGAMLYAYPTNSEIRKSAYVCTIDQLDESEDWEVRHYSGDQLLRVVFNKLSARLDLIEDRIRKIEEELHPSLEKPALNTKTVTPSPGGDK